jgi:hypothetical protein
VKAENSPDRRIDEDALGEDSHIFSLGGRHQSARDV